MNKITINPDLANVDYTDLLTKICQSLEKNQIFRTDNNHQWLVVDINQIAAEIATSQVNSPLGNAKGVRAATLNFSPGSQDRFSEQTSNITELVRSNLTSYLSKNLSLDRLTFVTQLIADLQTFRQQPTKFDLAYNFPPSNQLQQQRLTVRNNDGQHAQLLKAHKVKISVDKPSNFTAHLLEGINNFIDIQLEPTSEEKDDLEYILDNLEKNDQSDIHRLENLVNQQTLGKLKKLAKIKYLEFLYENIDDNASENNLQGKIYLQDLIRRLKLLDDYINNTNKADGEYIVNYQGVEVNYQNMFSRGEAFDMLPIIPLIEGYLGETEQENREKVEFIFGLKLKFDGKVQAYGGKTVFERNLDILHPDSQEHQEQIQDESRKTSFVYKVLKIAFLYYFLFASRQDPNNPQNDLEYNPITKWEQSVLPILQGSDEEAKKRLFRSIINGFDKLEVREKIKTLKGVLTKLIKRKTSFPTREYPLHISVKNSILEADINTIVDRDTFFKSLLRENPKDCLKYINLGEATTDNSFLVSLPAKMTISEIYFFETDDRETFQMEYDINITGQGIGVLPVVFVPANSCYEFVTKNLSNRKLVIFPYRPDPKKLEPGKLETQKLESHQEFIYKITYSLLAYICLYVLLEKKSKLFIPILRIHLNNKKDDAPIEKFIVSLTGVLSHLFNEQYRSNSQGIDISDFSTKGKFKIPNTLSALYSVLPKKFTFPPGEEFQFRELDKLAMIIVSSRGSDSRWGMEAKKSNLMGEIIDFQIQPQTVKLRLLKTFSENYDNHEDMFSYPSVIVENVDKLYKKGYRHFIYIAKVPYSTTLHITQTKSDELFFMSANVIKALTQERSDIKIYPMFFDKYYAVKVENKIKSTSLYIQDTVELTQLVEDSSKKSIVFFNLFNGIAVAKDTNYNGVMSYATLLNIYQGVLDDKDIRTGLIYQDSHLKSEILQCLTLFHFSRYQKHEKSGKLQIKLDPYQNLIGKESIGQLALLKYSRGQNAEFNSLAFLTHVRDILARPKSSS
ncbi:hypothetical protein NWP22_08135 [Anabaenopsis tanganyikae CS-531]|uniref:Uncharacterized protein n=1 Tax=Anabaenopsis tanganyikae CS-531 TaxID=2785304 RepID=A0ABT6KDI2_9CYAN|nr:hypothetical protein [Anabaenopsis tanganyikae]MDH6105833.1 hypothetical protein [Anabaenopsis tanganyikae CS-531]